MIQSIVNLQRKIEFWDLYVKQHQKTYGSRHMPEAWHKRISAINDKILEWRLDEIEMIKSNPSLYKRKMKLIENLFYQVEYHENEKKRIIEKYYNSNQDLDYGMVLHHQREAILLSEELHFEILKRSIDFNRV